MHTVFLLVSYWMLSVLSIALTISILLLVRRYRLPMCVTVSFCDRRLVTPKFRPMNTQNAHSYNGDLECKLSRGGLRYTVGDITMEHKEIRYWLDTLGSQ